MEMIRIRPPKRIIVLAIILVSMSIIGWIMLIAGIVLLCTGTYIGGGIIPLVGWVLVLIANLGVNRLDKY